MAETLFLSLLGAGTVLFLLLEFIRFHSIKVNAWFCSFFRLVLRESEATHLTGASYMLLGALLTFLIFTRDTAATSICFLAVGDAASNLIGGNNIQNGLRRKTITGKLACLLACIGVGSILYYSGLDISVVAVIIGAVVATIIEAIPKFLNDNLTIPLLAGLAITLVELVR